MPLDFNALEEMGIVASIDLWCGHCDAYISPEDEQVEATSEDIGSVARLHWEVHHKDTGDFQP